MEKNRASLTNDCGDELLLTGWSLKGDLQGMAFTATLEQTFVNSTGEHAEIIYNFPLPWGAELLGLEAIIGDKRLTGSVIGKKESETKYEEALADGDSAILLERNANYDYTLNLGGIQPDEKVVITLRYGQLLKFTKTGLRLCIPTVIAPRFGDPVVKGGLKPHQITDNDLLAEYAFNLEIALHGDWAEAGIESPSHNLKLGVAKEWSRVVSLAKDSLLDRDFVLSLKNPDLYSTATIVPDYANPGSHMILAAFRPDLNDNEQEIKPVNVKILVDCSGSMSGDSIEAARRALQAFVKELHESDRFSLSKFGDDVKHRSRGLWKAAEASKLAAQRWIAALDADMGGTEMEGALASTFELGRNEPADVLLVTDGDIHAIDDVIQVAKESNHRLFIVGIGSAPSEANLRRMAEETRGAVDFVAPGEAVAPAITNMFARLRTSAYRELLIAMESFEMISWMSPLDSMIYDCDTIYIAALMTGMPDGNIMLVGTNDSGSNTLLGRATLPSQTQSEPDLSRLAIAKYVNKLIKTDDPAGLKLAEDYQLVTSKTNLFMLVDRAEDKAKDMPELHKVSQMMPAGFGGLGSVSIRASKAYSGIMPDFRASPMGDAAISFSQYDLPAMRSTRFSRASASKLRVEDFSSQSVDHYEIPSFLRKAVDVIKGKKPTAQQPKWVLGKSNPQLYDWDAPEGLTTLGVREWLRHHPVNEWPQTYAGLAHMGVPDLVIDWLELCLARNLQADETTAVMSFLYTFVSEGFEQGFAASIEAFEASRVRADWGLVAHDLHQITKNEGFHAELVRVMATSGTKEWPVCIFNMETA